MRPVYIIMTHNPDEGLISYVEAMLGECVSRIVIVDETGDSNCRGVYDMLSCYPGCSVLSFGDAKGEEAYARALAWCDAHLAPQGFSETVRVEYADETQRQAVLEIAEIEAEQAIYDMSVSKVPVGIKNVYDSVLDTLGHYREVLKIWQPMRSRRAVAMA